VLLLGEKVDFCFLQRICFSERKSVQKILGGKLMRPQPKPFIVEKKKRKRVVTQRQTDLATLKPATGPPVVSSADRKPGPIGRLA
jgi:hypothetical protein